MPTKKPSLFEVSGSEPPREKKPTLYQFLKENNDISFPYLSGVEVIWFPGQWDNFSIETSVYRCSIAPTHGLYKIVDTSIVRILESTDTKLLLVIEDSSGCVRFSESNVYGKYQRIGNAGFRFVATEGAN
jgi:hypothetical protein